MLDEQIIDLAIAFYSIFSTILFGLTCIKRKFLGIWFIGSISFSVGAVTFYFRFLNEILRFVGDIFYMGAIIIFIFGSYYEYYSVFIKGMKKSREIGVIFLVFTSFSIISIQVLMVILLVIAAGTLIRIYLKQKSITRISMFFAMIIGLYTLFTTFLNNFGIEGTWELSYIGNIIVITFLLTTALAAPIEDRILKAEEKHRKSDEFLSNIFNSIQDGISVLDNQLNIVQVNPTMEKRHSYAMPLVGKKCYEAYHLRDKPCDLCPSQKTLETNQLSYEIVPRTGANGKIIGCNELYSFPLIDTVTGQMTGIIEYVRDITERVETEQKLKDSEQKFRHLFEESPLMIVLVDRDGKIIDCNKQLINHLEYEKSEVINNNIRDLGDLIPYEHLNNIIQKFNQALKLDFTEPVEFQIKKRSGELFWVRIHYSIIQIEGKTYVQVIIEDIENEKQAEMMVKKELKKLKELDIMRKNLITRISHELKTPLTSIFGISQLLLLKQDDLNIQSMSNFITILYRGSVRLKALIENLLDASRLDSDTLELIKERENIVSIIENCISEMMHLAKSRDLTVYQELPDDLYFEVDKLRLEQAIINLLSNAIKNTPRGGNIFINLSEDNGYIDIKIKDTGVGLTNDEKKMLFIKFGKIERYGMDLGVDIEGAGLGLYISKELIELHGGEIMAESEGRNKGAKFTIRLPK